LKQIKRSTFCDALERRRHDIYRSVFHTLVDKAQAVSGTMKKKFKDPLRIIDATIIPVCLKRINWAKYRKAKGAVKLHMNLDGDRRIPFDAYMTEGKVHDVKGMKNLTQETGVIYALDRAYVQYKSLYSIQLQGSIFVSRMKSNCAFKRIHNNPHKEGGSILDDVVIELTGTASKKAYPKPLRKIKYKDLETKKVYEFLTNDMGREAEEIAGIYKERWEVELFFRWIKQHLKVKSFWGTSINAVYSQIWVALILTILLWINRTLDGITASPYKLMILMKSAFLTKNSLGGLCTNIIKPKSSAYSLQPFLNGFKS
jgi:transposase